MPDLVKALKVVDLPTLGRPTMPHWRLMVDSGKYCASAKALLYRAGQARPGLTYHAGHVGYPFLSAARRLVRTDRWRPHGVLADLAEPQLHAMAAAPHRAT